MRSQTTRPLDQKEVWPGDEARGWASGLQRFFATGEIPVLASEGDLERIGP